MAPAGKQKPETQVPAPALLLLECALSKDVDLTPVLPRTATESREHGRTLIWPGATATAGVEGGLHLQPNSIFLLSVSSFYCEAFVGMRPSVALFHHFFSLRLDDGARLWACISFVKAQGGSLLLKTGKKVESFRHCWVLMSLKDAKPWLEVPKGLPEKTFAWSSAMLSDLRVVPILERFPHDNSAKRLIGDDPGDQPESLVPLNRLDNRADQIAALLVFDEWVLIPAEGSGLVEVSSDDTFGREDFEKSVDDSRRACLSRHGPFFCASLKMMMSPAMSPR
ncbi:hypothetical protein D1007_49251 [Hordeum vulgare]|nr:hypothetical protein D1007_49251 [Hordeum vulgare]